GEIGWAILLIQNEQVLLQPPSRITYGCDARQRDVRALAGLCLDLLDQIAEPPVGAEGWESLREALRAVHQLGTALSARRLAERLTQMAEREAARPGAERSGLLVRLVALATRWARRTRTPSR